METINASKLRRDQICGVWPTKTLMVEWCWHLISHTLPEINPCTFTLIISPSANRPTLKKKGCGGIIERWDGPIILIFALVTQFGRLPQDFFQPSRWLWSYPHHQTGVWKKRPGWKENIVEEDEMLLESWNVPPFHIFKSSMSSLHVDPETFANCKSLSFFLSQGKTTKEEKEGTKGDCVWERVFCHDPRIILIKKVFLCIPPNTYRIYK